jgi:hypothetical protein
MTNTALSRWYQVSAGSRLNYGCLIPEKPWSISSTHRAEGSDLVWDLDKPTNQWIGGQLVIDMGKGVDYE